LQSADRGTREPSQFGRAKLFLLPRAQNVQALRGEALRVIQQGRFQHLARQFSGSGELRERTTGGLIQLRENTIDRLLLFESIGNQCIGFDCGQWPGVYCDLHGSPFFELKLRFVERSVKFANPRNACSPLLFWRAPSAARTRSTYRWRNLYMASPTSRLASLSRSVWRRSHFFFPWARAISHLAMPS